MTAILAGVLFGLVGSGHCAAMCGPLVLLATPRGASTVSRLRLAAPVALYHGGRTVTYMVLGAVAGVAGSALARLGLGRGLAVVAGVLLVVQALVATRVIGGRLQSHRLATVVAGALGRAAAWMHAHRVQGPAVFGALNGLLPCGFLYAALTAAAGMGDLGQALVFMAAFAVGTTPVLAVVILAGDALGARVPRRVRRMAPVALAVVGVLLIMRGVNAPHGHARPEHADPPAATSTHQH